MLKIVHYPHPVLKRPAKPVRRVDDELRAIVREMFGLMYQAKGIGLAANQVGVSLRVAVIDLSVGKRPGECHVFINPEIAEREGEITEEEGCLSIPDFTEVVTRPERVKLRSAGENSFDCLAEEIKLLEPQAGQQALTQINHITGFSRHSREKGLEGVSGRSLDADDGSAAQIC